MRFHALANKKWLGFVGQISSLCSCTCQAKVVMPILVIAMGGAMAQAEDWGYDALDLAGGGYSGDFTRKTYTTSYIWYQIIKTSNPAATGDQWHKFNDNGSWTKQWGEYTGFTLTPNNDVQFNGSIDAGGSAWGWGDPASFNINLENSKSYVINVFNDDDIIGGPGNDVCGVAVVEVNHQSGLMSLGTPVTSNDATYCYLNVNNASAEAASSVEEVWFQWTTNNFGTKNYVEIIDLPAYTTLRLAMTTDIKPGAQLKWLAMTTANISTATVVSTTSGVGNFDAAAIHKTDVQTYWVKPPYSAWEIVDEFMYDEGGQLNAKSGGFGWTNGNTWVESSAGAYTISAGSFGNVTGYPTNLGNKVVVTPGAGQSLTAYRTFPTVNTGVIFAAAFVNHTTGGADRWMGLSFCSNGTERAFFGELAGQDQKLGLGSYDGGSSETASPYSLTAGVGSDYIIIGKYDFQTKQFSTKGYYKTDAIPSVQPAAWDATTTLAADRIISLNGVRLGAGGANSPGACYFDEVRVARSWAELLNKVEPVWTGSGTTFAWENATNWSGYTVPAAAAVAIFGDSFANGTTISNTAAVTTAGLRFNEYADGNLLFTNRSVTPAMTINGAGIAVSSGSGGTHALAIQRVNIGADQSWTNESAQTLTFNTQLRSTGNVTKQGSGRMTLTYQANASDFSGTMTVNNGPLRIVKASALGGTAAGTTAAVGGALELAPGSSAETFDAEPLTLSGGGVAEDGALRNIQYNNKWQGAITLAAAARISSDSGNLTLVGGINGDAGGRNVFFGGAGNLSVSNAAVGANVGQLIKDGAGILNLSFASTYAGATIISNGTMILGAADVIPNGSAVSVASGATLTATNDTVGSVAGGGTISLRNDALLTVGGDNTSTTFSGPISGASDDYAHKLIKTGSGTLVLAGNNSYGGTAQGGIQILNGKVSVPTIAGASTDQPLGDSTATNAVQLGDTGTTGVLLYTGANGSTTKDVHIPADGTGAIEVDSGSTTMTVSGVISGAGNFNKTGNGALTIGRITNASTIAVNAGKLIMGGLVDAQNVTVASGATLMGDFGDRALGTLTVNGTVDPADVEGTNSTMRAAALALNNNANILWNISSTNMTGQLCDYFLIGGGTGDVDINATDGNDVVIKIIGNPPGFDNTASYTWTIMNAGNLIDFDSTKFTLNTTGFTPALGSGSFTINSNNGDMEIRFAAGPEIAVLGTNSAEIADGDTSPTLDDGTDFGRVEVNASMDHTFFVTNSGSGALTISGVTTSGAQAAEFVVREFPSTVTPATKSNLTVRFTPTATGTRTATITVNNDDGSEATYDFVVQGTGYVRSITIDGDPSDWLGIAPTVVNSATVSSNEFIIKDKHWEAREDSDHDDDVDLTEFRVFADADNIYFLATFSDITDIAYPYLAIAVDSDRNNADDAMTWMADDSGTSIGGDYNDTANAHYPERNIIVHTINGVGQRIELYADSGSSWYAPPTLGNDQCNFSAANNVMEIKIDRDDLGLAGSITGRFTVASYHAVVPGGWANDGDTTAAYGTTDALDALNILKYSFDDGAGDASAWDEELSDGDIDSWFDVALNTSGVMNDSLPTAPGNLAARTNDAGNVESVDGNVRFAWDRSTDANDKVTSYLVEFNSGALGENAAITHRENVASNALYLDTTELIGQANGSYNLRVRARDAQGALSAASDISFTLSSTDDDIAGPTPSLVYLGTTNYNGVATNTSITDAELANAGNKIDFAIGWTDPSGVFLTNHNEICNIGSPDGRVTPNWEVWYSLGSVTNNVAGTPENNMFSNRVVGYNGGLSVTTYQNNAFTIGDFDTNNTYYITISAEDEDNDRGAYADAVGEVGDNIEYDRTVRTNYLLTFLTAAQVIDDDSAGPQIEGGTDYLRICGDATKAYSVTDADLATQGFSFTSRVRDIYSGVWGGASNWFRLFRPEGQVGGVTPCTPTPAEDSPQASWAADHEIGGTQRVSYAEMSLGTWTVSVQVADTDRDKLNDSLVTVSNFEFTVTDDDAVAPEYRTMTYGGLGSAYLVVATNTAADGAITERDGSSTNRVFWLTDEYLAHLSAAPLYLAFGCLDAASGMSCGNNASTNQVCSWRLLNFATEATLLSSETTVPRWQVGLSSADGINRVVTNVWSFADQAQFTAGVIDDLYNASTSKVVAMLVDGDNDRTNDRAALASAQVGILGVYDEDTNTPVLLSFRVNGPVSAPGLALLDGEMTNAISMTGMVRDVNGVYGTGSGFAPRYSLYSPLGLVSNNDLLDGFNISNGDGTGTNFHYGKHQVRAWYEMNTLGTWTCRVTFADYDTDRTGDSAVGVSNFAFSVSDDDVRGPAMKGLDVVAMPELIHCDFFTDWDQHSEGDWSDADANGTWYGYGMYVGVGTSSDGDGRRAGFNTAGDYLVLPPKDYPGQLTLSAYLSGAGAETISVERANGAAWTRIAEMEVNNNDSYDNYAFQIYDTNTAVTLRVYCVTRDARSIYFDDVRVDGIATWTNLASLDVTFLAARDPGNSGVYEYRRTALDDPEPTGLGDGSTLGTGTNFTLAGGGLPEGIHTGYLFAVDNDVDRANDRTKGANTRYVVKIDRTQPTQPANFKLMDAGFDDESEAGIQWDPPGDDGLSPWHSYRVYWNYGDHDVAATDQYYDVTAYPELGVRQTNAIILTNLLSGQTYNLAVAGRDGAGNEGVLTAQTNILIGFLVVTQAEHVGGTKIKLKWTGSAAAKTYNVIYKDTTAYSDALTNASEWALLNETLSEPYYVDTNAFAMGDNLRFYRVSYKDRWDKGSHKKASAQVYVGKRIRLYSGRNWVTLPAVPDTNSVVFIFGSDLPRGILAALATRISWVGGGIDSWAATQQVYLANDAKWYYSMVGPGKSVGSLAGDAALPDNQPVIINIPGNGISTQLFFAGRLPATNYQPQISVIGGLSSTNRAYTFFTFNTPGNATTNMLNTLRDAGFRPWRGSAPISDAIWTYNKATQRNGYQIFYRNNTWQYFDGAWKNYSAGFLKSDDGLVVRSVTNVVPYLWKPVRAYNDPTLDLH